MKRHCWGSDAVSFTFQPIVDPFASEIVSLEALLRGPQGKLPPDSFSHLSRDQAYLTDIRSKKITFAQAKQLGIESQTLSINLLPMSLVDVPDAAPFLLNEIDVQGLVPEPIRMECTENEAIFRLDEFEAAIQ